MREHVWSHTLYHDLRSAIHRSQSQKVVDLRVCHLQFSVMCIISYSVLVSWTSTGGEGRGLEERGEEHSQSVESVSLNCAHIPIMPNFKLPA